ncbi:MAG TPA: hypothetical protein VGU20_04215 [Stellaceae bacterium]|nr:hypothetical protein [Stellaceae bacterium]
MSADTLTECRERLRAVEQALDEFDAAVTRLPSSWPNEASREGLQRVKKMRDRMSTLALRLTALNHCFRWKRIEP